MTTAQDPIVRAHLSRTRWYRGRQLVLAAVAVATVLGFVVRHRWNPRPLYLLGFDDEETIDWLNRLLVDTCPGFEINRTRLRCSCGLIDPGSHPHY